MLIVMSLLVVFGSKFALAEDLFDGAEINQIGNQDYNCLVMRHHNYQPLWLNNNQLCNIPRKGACTIPPAGML